MHLILDAKALAELIEENESLKRKLSIVDDLTSFSELQSLGKLSYVVKEHFSTIRRFIK